MLKVCRTPGAKALRQRLEKGEKLDLGSLEPAAIQFTLEHLQESTRRSGISSSLCICIHIGTHSIVILAKQ